MGAVGLNGADERTDVRRVVGVGGELIGQRLPVVLRVVLTGLQRLQHSGEHHIAGIFLRHIEGAELRHRDFALSLRVVGDGLPSAVFGREGKGVQLGALVIAHDAEGAAPPAHQVALVALSVVAGGDEGLTDILDGMLHHLHALGTEVHGALLHNDQIGRAGLDNRELADEDELTLGGDGSQAVEAHLTGLELGAEVLRVGQAGGEGAAGPRAVAVVRGGELAVVADVDLVAAVAIQRLGVVGKVGERHISHAPEEARIVAASVDMGVGAPAHGGGVAVGGALLAHQRGGAVQHGAAVVQTVHSPSRTHGDGGERRVVVEHALHIFH